MKKLWSEGIRADREQNSGGENSILGTASYFLDNLERVSKPDYVPTNEDVLRLRRATQGADELKITFVPEKDSTLYKFVKQPLDLHIVDVGGQAQPVMRCEKQSLHRASLALVRHYFEVDRGGAVTVTTS